MAIVPLLKNTKPEVRGASNKLVVAIHSNGTEVVDFREAIRESLPDADLLIPEYDSSIFSNVDPRKVANQLVQYIHEADLDRSQRSDRGAYESIILIGHSRGGLIIRKTYLIGMGYGDDEELLANSEVLPWVKKVERIVLMAGINRGLSDSKPKNMSFGKYAIQRLGWTVLPLFGRQRSLLHLRKGSPFVANLRVQWIRLSQDPDIQIPFTIQLLGDNDDIVAEEDSIDLLVDVSFKYLKIRDTGHSSIFDFKDPNTGSHRKDRFQYALLTPIEQFNGDTIANKYEVGQTKDSVIFIMHGIRDMGLWTTTIGNVVESLSKEFGQSVQTIKAGYGYFPMLRFLVLGARQANVRWFMDEYTEAIARYPNAKISFIGHSNGTYLLASALERYAACKVHHVAFAGSVVPKNYPWDDLVHQGRVKAIRNDIASADWVVGIFPGFFELVKFSDIGTAGHNGFQDNAPRDSSFEYFFKGDHGAAIQPKNHKSLATFILTGKKFSPEQGLIIKQQNSLVVILAKLCWLVCLLIFVALVFLGFIFTTWLSLLGISLLLACLIYASLMLLLLYTL